jgi:tetratricopeptide (TPR) repeat protein
VYYEARGDEDAAEKAYALALRVEPRTVGPRSNLAALLERRRYRLQQQVQRAILERDRAALSSLTAEIGKLQERIETLRREELSLLERDARLAPDNVDVLYRYGLALYLNGQEEKAAEVLERGADRAPDATRFHYALALLYQKRQQLDLAIRHAERLTQLDPGHEPYRLLLEELRKQQQKPQSSQP